MSNTDIFWGFTLDQVDELERKLNDIESIARILESVVGDSPDDAQSLPDKHGQLNWLAEQLEGMAQSLRRIFDERSVPQHDESKAA